MSGDINLLRVSVLSTIRVKCLNKPYSPPFQGGEAARSADGVVTRTEMCGVSNHPVRSIKGGFAAFSLCRVHPSLKRRGILQSLFLLPRFYGPLHPHWLRTFLPTALSSIDTV